MILSELINPILVINLDRDQDRLEHIKKTLQKYGLQDRLIRIPAILGSELTKDDLKTINNPITMQSGAIGCGMSHKNAWKYMIDNNIPHALILEDDATINELILKLDNIIIPDNWDVVYVGYHMRGGDNTCSRIANIKDREHIKHVNNNVLKYEFNTEYIVGCYGYILSQKSARKLYDIYNIEIAVDKIIPFQGKDMNIYMINPKPVTHCYDFGSSTRSIFNVKKVKNFKETYYDKIINNNINNNINIFKYILIPVLIILFLFFIKNKQYKHIFIYMILITICLLYTFLYHKKHKEKWYIYLDNLLLENNDIMKNHTLVGTCGSYYDPFESVWTQKGILLAQGLLQKLSNVCKENNIPWSIFYGTMIGWARHNKQPIPWDDDLDVIMSRDYSSIIKEAFENDTEIGYCINPLGEKHNFSKIYWKNKGMLIPYTHKCNQKITWPFIDIFFYSYEGDTMSVAINREIKMPSQFEYIPTTFMGVPTFVFKNYKYILYQVFGASWYRMCKSSPYNHRLEIPNIKCSLQSEKCSVLMLDPSYDIENQIIENIPDQKLKILLRNITNSETELNNSKNNNIIKLILNRYKCPLYNKNRDRLIPQIRNYLSTNPQRIPKIIHQIWIGPNKPPEKWINTIKDFVKQNPGWKYILWDDESIAELGLINSNEYDNEKSYNGKSDVIRYEVLFRYGGIYIDADTIWLKNRSFDELLDAKSGFFLSYETYKENGLASSVVGSSQYNPITYYIIKNMENITTLCKGIPAFKTVGPYILDRSLTPIKDIITVHPSYYFFPTFWVGNGKEKRDFKTLKNKYKDSFLFQYGYSTNGYNDNDEI